MEKKHLDKKLESFSPEKLMKWLSWIFAFAIAIMFSTLTFYLTSFNGGLSDDNGKWGTFGDFFGGTLNPILSFMSLTALLLTVSLQSRQAEISLKELEETRNELARSANAQEKTERIQTKQLFETTFFNLIELHHKIASELKLDANRVIKKYERDTHEKYLFQESRIAKKGTFDGRLVFDGVVDFISHYSRNNPEIIFERYKFIQKENNDILGHYFRNLYQILKLIKRTSDKTLSTKEKSIYSSILRSQLSSKELALLFLNCLDGVSDDGRFRNLLIEFNILEHLPISIAKFSREKNLEISGAFHVSKNMVLQYREPKEFPPLELDKYYGGAFGKNRGIPYDLAREPDTETALSIESKSRQ